MLGTETHVVGKAFTTTVDGRVAKLLNEVDVSRTDGSCARSYVAQWDTGAERTCVSQRVVSELGLEQLGCLRLSSPAGVEVVPTYKIVLHLPNNTAVVNYEVPLARFDDCDVDVLVGLDVITNGEFAVGFDGERTQFTFRVPANALPDFCAPDARGRAGALGA